LAQVLNRVVDLFPEEYDFVPRTWNLPAELQQFKDADARRHAVRHFASCPNVRLS
jgi:hypothetical protein